MFGGGGIVFRIHSQHVDSGSGYHNIELRDERGNRHMLQIAIGHETCPGCGAVYPKNNLDEIDPKAAVDKVSAALNRSKENMAAYAARHGVRVK